MVSTVRSGAKILLLTLGLSFAACQQVETPKGRQVAGQEAVVRFVLDYAFFPHDQSHDPVSVLSPTCGNDRSMGKLRGFTDPSTGSCVWGLTEEGAGTWISLEPGVALWSQTALCHEVAGHQAYGDHYHTRAEIFGPPDGTGDFLGGLVGACMRALSLHPDLDAVGDPLE